MSWGKDSELSIRGVSTDNRKDKVTLRIKIFKGEGGAVGRAVKIELHKLIDFFQCRKYLQGSKTE